MFWKKHRIKIIASAAIVAILAVAFWYGGNMPGSKGLDALSHGEPAASEPADVDATDVPTATPSADNLTPTPAGSPDAPEAPEPSASVTPDDGDEEPTPTPEETPPPVIEAAPPAMEINPDTGTDKYLTDPVPEGKPLPVEPQDAAVGTAELTCTISVSCATILDNMSYLDTEKHELVPEDGWILEAVTVTFYEGESVFNVLQRTMKQNKIHMEFVNTPMYNSAYIEAINNLYEFDVGEGSGWMYKINDWFPNYGCSRYQLSDGDIIEWVYTCDLGYDVGGGYAAGNE